MSWLSRAFWDLCCQWYIFCIRAAVQLKGGFCIASQATYNLDVGRSLTLMTLSETDFITHHSLTAMSLDFNCVCTLLPGQPASIPESNLRRLPHLREVQVNEAESEELQTDGEAVEQPVGGHGQVIGLYCIAEVEGEEDGSQGCPQQAQEEKDALVAPALVSVQVEEPELNVDHQEEPSVQRRVQDGKAQLDRRSHGRLQGHRRGQRGGVGRRSSSRWIFFHAGSKGGGTNCP